MFEAIKAALKDSPDNLALVATLEGVVTGKIGVLTGEVTAMEGRFNVAKSENDKSKDKLKLVRAKLGVEEITEDSLTESVAAFSTGDDSEALKTKNIEISQMSDAAKTAKTDRDAEKLEWDKKETNLKIANQLLGMGASINALNKYTAGQIDVLMMAGAEMDGDDIVYKKDGVTQRVDGEKLTPAMRLKQIQESEDTGILFKTKAKSGSNTPNGGNGKGGLGKFAARRANAKAA